MSKWIAFAIVLLVCTQAGAQGLSVLQVVGQAKQQSPTLKAAMLQFESAQWDLRGAEAQYDYVLGVNTDVQQQATSNVFSGAVRINTVKRADLAATLSKHLIWGTDLSLTLSSYVQQSKFSGGLGLSPTMGVGTGIASLPGVFTAFGSFGPVYSFIAKLELKQPLWKGRGRDVGEATIQQSRASKAQRERGGERVASELLRDLLTAYWELWYAGEAVEIQKQSREVASRQRDEADARTRSGSLAPADVLAFERQVATSDESVLSAETDRAARVHELVRLIGSDVAFEDVSDEPLGSQAYVRITVEQRALGESKEVQEQLAAVELARIQQKTADDPQKPQLDLDTYIQTQGLGLKSVGDAANQFVSGDVISGFIGLTFQAPVRDRARRAAAAKARLASEVAEQQLREVKQRVLAQARGALDKEAAGEQRVALAERTVSIAERQLNAEQLRYQSGSSTSIAVLEAQDAVRTAKLRLARARADCAESALIIDHLSGDLLKRYAQK